MKTGKIFAAGIFLGIALFTAACASATSPNQPSGATTGPGTTTTVPTPIPIKQPATEPVPTPTLVSGAELDPRVQEANTDFGFRLFRRLVEQNPDQNVFMSPLSVAIALAMTYNGA